MELTEDQLKVAEIELQRQLPQSLKIYGFLVLRNRVKSDPYIVLVDRWPQFSVIICKPKYKQKTDLFKDTMVFANDEAILTETLRNSSVIDWSRYLCLGITLPHMELVKAVAAERNVPNNQLSLCHMMILEDVSKLPAIDCSGICLSSLAESHLDLVNQTWKFGSNEGAARMIRNMVTNFPSCCVLDSEGKPVSWILTYVYCAVGMLYTLPEHRGKGYAKVLISSMAKNFSGQGYPVFCFIEEENRTSYQLFKGMGFSEDPSYRETWYGFNDF
ncbi:glycine N-acyltransferase-like protein 3 [Poecilia latipinna]|uniref:Glycine N-acyltransferase-like protein n=1 Tax=Poecilia formosa TaxID=48698 RepID=A0A087YGZ5_POEFO|nr:PREDICTED: glycine N-acyltransferase-like protein 3 [Poecilia formosa]XP_014907217.1 PREDICTED: glycine N-acyltransferase-like protein 3 [Poecilia latipinna]